jgi:ATP phosphoribosyltransferase
VDVRRREAEDRARKKKKDAEKQAAEERRRQRLDVRDNVHVLMHLQRAAAQRLDELHAGAESVSDSEVEDCWAAMAMVCDYERRMVREYRALAGVDRPEAEAVIYGE